MASSTRVGRRLQIADDTIVPDTAIVPDEDFAIPGENFRINILDPNTQESQLEIAYSELANLDQQVLAPYGITIIADANTLTVRCEGQSSIELSGNLPFSSLDIASTGKVRLNQGVKPSNSLRIKATEVKIVEKIATIELVLDSPTITADSIIVPIEGTAKILDSQNCVFRDLRVAGKFDFQSSLVGCDKIYVYGNASLNAKNCTLNLNRSLSCYDASAVNIRDSKLLTDLIICNSLQLDNTTIKARRASFYGVAEVKNSKLFISNNLYIHENSDTQFVGCEIESSTYYGDSKCQFFNTKLKTEFFDQNSDAEYTDCIIEAVDHFDLHAKQKALRTKFIAGLFWAYDELTLEKSEISCDSYQNDGKVHKDYESKIVTKNGLIVEQEALPTASNEAERESSNRVEEATANADDAVPIVHEENDDKLSEPKSTYNLLDWITSIPRKVSIEIGGWSGKISILVALIKVMEVCEPLIMSSFAAPIINWLIAAAFPQAIFAAELIQVLASPEFYLASLAALEIFNENLINDCFNQGSDEFRTYAKEFLELENQVPKKLLSFDYVKYQVKSLLVGIASLAGGFMRVTSGLFLAGVLSNVAFNTMVKKIPFISATSNVVKNFGSYLRSAIGSAILIVFTDEIYNTVGGWGTSIGQSIVNAGFDTVNSFVEYASSFIKGNKEDYNKPLKFSKQPKDLKPLLAAKFESRHPSNDEIVVQQRTVRPSSP